MYTFLYYLLRKFFILVYLKQFLSSSPFFEYVINWVQFFVANDNYFSYAEFAIEAFIWRLKLQ